jgi:hypothetical protein
MMTGSDLFERLFGLLGRPSDDPAILALHAEEGIGPPPIIYLRQDAVEVPVEGQGYGLTYRAFVRAEASWPPRLAETGFVGYLHSIYLGPRFARHLPAPLSPDMDESQAKEQAVARAEEPYHTSYHLIEREGRVLEASYWRPEGGLMFMRLTLLEWNEADPRVKALSSELKKAASAAYRQQKREREAFVRVVPRWEGKPEPEPLPAPIAELHQALQAHREKWPNSTPADDFDINYRAYDARTVGDIGAWTHGEADAEAEFWIFASNFEGSVIGFWLVHDRPLAEQPVVYIGSEGSGDISATAKNLPDFLALMAAGVGPTEVHGGKFDQQPVLGARAILRKYFPDYRLRPASDIAGEAARLFHDFEARVWALCGKDLDGNDLPT